MILTDLHWSTHTTRTVSDQSWNLSVLRPAEIGIWIGRSGTALHLSALESNTGNIHRRPQPQTPHPNTDTYDKMIQWPDDPCDWVESEPPYLSLDSVTLIPTIVVSKLRPGEIIYMYNVWRSFNTRAQGYLMKQCNLRVNPTRKR